MNHRIRIALLSLPLALVALGLAGLRSAAAHCEVPCGIYDDPARFKGMLEDASTITKAMAEIDSLAGKQDAQSANQLVRWVNTKEVHATHVMETISQYFMAQRIKPGEDEAGMKRYTALLTSAHGVMRAAMTCKQKVGPEHAAALRSAVEAFQKLYDAG